MTDAHLVSVIVPVYNVREYLAECFDSICGQTYDNIEIILVDDGSTDGSGELCDELALKDDRVVVIHKLNGGLSDARNTGLRASKGSWVSFVDSDDYISSVFIEALLRAAINSDCLISAIPFGHQFHDEKKPRIIEHLADVPMPSVLSSRETQRLMLYQALDTGAPWRLYRREVLGESPFPCGLYYEDLASIYKVIHRVDSIALINTNDLYAYRMRRDGIMRQEYSQIKTRSALAVVDELYREISTWYPDLAPAAASRCFSLCRMVFAQIPRCSGDSGCFNEDVNALWNVLKRFYRVVLFDSQARKRERLAAFFVFAGKAAFSSFCTAARKLGLMR